MPPLPTYLETLWATQRSEAAVEELIGCKRSLGIPIITSIPVPIRALSEPGSASNNLTFLMLLSFRRSTTVVGDNLWEEMVPQFTPIPVDSATLLHIIIIKIVETIDVQAFL